MRFILFPTSVTSYTYLLQNAMFKTTDKAKMLAWGPLQIKKKILECSNYSQKRLPNHYNMSKSNARKQIISFLHNKEMLPNNEHSRGLSWHYDWKLKMSLHFQSFSPMSGTGQEFYKNSDHTTSQAPTLVEPKLRELCSHFYKMLNK